MDRSESIKEIATALSKAQKLMEGASKDKTNPFFKAKYADLASVKEAIREPLADNGLSYTQIVHDDPLAAKIETVVMHSSGEWFSNGILSVPVSKNDAQGFGSAITYARRYSLQAAFGVAPEDDDRNAAVQAKPTVSKIPSAIQNKVHEDTLRYLESGDEVGMMETWHGFGADEKAVLWGLFNSQQRSAIKKLLTSSAVG